MILGIFNCGSGLGNQLARLVATRVRAADLGVDWGMIYSHDNSGKEMGFKGKSFMDIEWDDLGAKPYYTMNRWQEKCVRDEFGNDIRSYDPEFNFIEDNTIIEGEFQDERYWEHREKEVDEWLKVEPLDMPDDLCVIGFRGGEFSVYPDLFLTEEYWCEGIQRMLVINPDMKFEIHTDDKNLATQFFEECKRRFFGGNALSFKVIHDIGINWRSMRYAKYAIIANSSFFILPRWLNKGVTIAPRYWGRRNTKVWSLPQNFYKRFLYL